MTISSRKSMVPKKRVYFAFDPQNLDNPFHFDVHVMNPKNGEIQQLLFIAPISPDISNGLQYSPEINDGMHIFHTNGYGVYSYDFENPHKPQPTTNHKNLQTMAEAYDIFFAQAKGQKLPVQPEDYVIAGNCLVFYQQLLNIGTMTEHERALLEKWQQWTVSMDTFVTNICGEHRLMPDEYRLDQEGRNEKERY
jgi:hypothetical protein